MELAGIIFRILGGLALFLYGMKVMSDGIQRGAGDRIQRAFNFVTMNRFTGVLTGFIVTAIIQSSSAATIMVVSFVNAGLLNLTQAIGVIMGANIGTTLTAWIVSLVGFTVSLSNFALPAIAIGLIVGMTKWKYKVLGDIAVGFGILFLGLDFMADSMPQLGDGFFFFTAFSDRGFLTILVGWTAGLILTTVINSSTATIAVIITMTYNGMIGYEMAAAMVLGANVGTTSDTALSAIGARTAAVQTAMAHVFFNIIGTAWALILIKPLLGLVDFLTPGTITGAAHDAAAGTHLAMLHTIFNIVNVALFLPFVNQFAAFIRFLFKGKKTEDPAPEHYSFEYKSLTLQNAPELNIMRAENEIQDMAALALGMYEKFSEALQSMQENQLTEDKIASLINELKTKENYADEMREVLSSFLMECTRSNLNLKSEKRVSSLMRVITDLEDLTDDCFSASLILERSVRKNQLFKEKEISLLIPYVGLVGEFLSYYRQHKLGDALSEEQTAWAKDLEKRIDDSRDKLQKLSRKRIEAGKDVKTELLFIDLVRRIEKMGDYCFDIASALATELFPRRGFFSSLLRRKPRNDSV